MNVAVIGRDGDCTAIALHRIAVAGHDLAVAVEREMSVARVALAVRASARRNSPCRVIARSKVAPVVFDAALR